VVLKSTRSTLEENRGKTDQERGTQECLGHGWSRENKGKMLAGDEKMDLEIQDAK
jgi:hypothetical protein